MHKLIQGLHHFQNPSFGNRRGPFERLAGARAPTFYSSRGSDGWVYETETGEVHGYRPDTAAFAPLVENRVPAAAGE